MLCSEKYDVLPDIVGNPTLQCNPHDCTKVGLCFFPARGGMPAVPKAWDRPSSSIRFTAAIPVCWHHVAYSDASKGRASQCNFQVCIAHYTQHTPLLMMSVAPPVAMHARPWRACTLETCASWKIELLLWSFQKPVRQLQVLATLHPIVSRTTPLGLATFPYSTYLKQNLHGDALSTSHTEDIYLWAAS